MPSRAMKRNDSQLTLVLFSSNFGCGCACRLNTRRRVFVFRSFFSSDLLNALLECQKMVNPRSRGQHPKLIVRFNSTLTLHGSLLAISVVNILD
jgi:hypothetical protein